MHIYTDGTVLLTHGGVEMGQVPPCFTALTQRSAQQAQRRTFDVA